jgi:signal transduction histidine kinase/PAS domain-containing protein
MSQRFMPASQSLPEERSEMLPSSLMLLDAVVAPVFVQDAKFQWVHVNAACCTLLGQPATTLLDPIDNRVFTPATLAELEQMWRQVLRTGTPTTQDVTLVTCQGQRQNAIAQITRLDHQDTVPFLVTTLKPSPQSAAVEGQQSRLRQLNAELEGQVEQRTQQLNQALEFEATLKRITDRVRDSLDETQILQTAVQEVSQALGAKGANTALYNLEEGTSTIYYEYNESLPSYQGRVAQMEAFPEVYHQLLDGQYFQFCSKQPNPVRGHVSMLACPILDDRGVLGDLWLINGSEHGFQEPEIRLVQQVANQCAIAIRQARLYQAAQSQVKELERLNQLKDDFLSTVSHELRTPVTSMRVALQLLGVTLNQEFNLNEELQKPLTERSRIARYYHVLREECEREISLINDLLDLQRLDGGNHPIHAQPIDITTWLPSLVSGFQERTQTRQQALDFQVEAALPKLVSDSASLDRVFAELLNNACKYTPPGESITLSVNQASSQQLCFQVTNSGVEIPPDELPRIFDKFYRVPSADPWKQGGTGLGLALVQKLLWHMGGEINVTSTPQQTCFTVMLPTDINQASL